MSHTAHILLRKETLALRAQILRAMREFFWSEGFLEVETPILVRLPGQEPHLYPMNITLHDEQGRSYAGYLHTSPEYTLKKMLACGFEKIFTLCKVFRDRESFGGTHNPEFTMIEWYRARADFYALMDDVEKLLRHLISDLSEKIQNTNNNIQFQKVHMRDIWRQTIQIDLDLFLTQPSLLQLCKDKGYASAENEPYEDLFYRIFLNEIEPKLKTMGFVILHHYPAPMAALSKLSEKEFGYAERMEVYIDGVEIANGFSELTDPAEQRSRLEAELHQRNQEGKDIFPIDEDFIEAVGGMPQSAGIALGVDRLVMILAGCKKIEDVLSLPASLLFQRTK